MERDFGHLLYVAKDGVATITLNRVERLNGFTDKTVYQVVEAIDLADADDDVRVIVFTGNGRTYSVGSDLSEAGADTFDYDKLGVSGDSVPPDLGGLITLRLYDCRKPVIVAFNGTAAGVGLTMSLAADIRLSVPEAKFCFPFVRRGIVPESASSWFLPRLVGLSKALEWMMSGRVFTADEALAGGLIRSVHPGADLLDEAYRLAREIADNTSPVSVALTRQMLWKMIDAPHPMLAHRLDSAAVYATGRGPDAKEGVASFLEKRPARYTSRPSKDMPDFYPWWKNVTYQED